MNRVINSKGIIEEANSDWVGATVYEDKPTRAGGAIVFFLCFSLVVSVLAIGAVDPWALALQVIGASVLMLLWTWDAWTGKELVFSKSLLQLPLAALILIGLVQLLPLGGAPEASRLLTIPTASALSLDPAATTYFIIQLAVYLIYFAAALAFVNNQKRLRAVTATLVVFGLLIGVFGIVQSFAGEDKIYWSREAFQANPFGTYVNGHHFAALMEMTIALTLGVLYARAAEKEIRVLHIFAAVVMGVALILTASRGGIISLLGVLGFLTLMNLKGGQRQDENGKRGFLSRKLSLAGSAGLLLLVLFGTTIMLGGDSRLLRGIGLLNASEDVSSGRLHFWQTSLEIIRHNPLLGVGLDAFGVAYTPFDTWNGIYRLERAHNDYLQILAETGVIGFACLVAFLFLLFKQGSRVISQTQDKFRRGVALGALAGCFGIALHSFFDFPLRTPANALIFLTLAALATVQISYPKLHRRRNK